MVGQGTGLDKERFSKCGLRLRGSTKGKNNSHKDTKTLFTLYTVLTFIAIQKQ